MSFGLNCIAATLALAALAAQTGCTTASPSPVATGVTSGPLDTHCTPADAGKKTQETNASACHPDAGAPAEAGADAAAPAEESAPTMYNQEGDDDDCKYHVKWSAAAVAQNADVTFTVTATKKTDGTPLTGAAPYTEPFLTDTKPGDASKSKTVETSPGVYTIGPIRFNAAGKWTVRFHFFGDCEDSSEDSPHGHAAFFVTVP